MSIKVSGNNEFINQFRHGNNVHCDISMTTQWAPGPLHSKGQMGVFLLQEVLFALVVHSVGVSEYEHYTAQGQESP